MSEKTVPARVVAAAADVGSHLAATRKLQRLTAQQVSERADISRGTLRRLEHGEPTVSFEIVLRVARALGVLDSLVASLDPFETDFGRAQAEVALPKRVRHGR